MPDAITSQNWSSYEPAAADSNHCDASTASCPVVGAAPVASAPAVNLEPVQVTGDLGSAAKELVRKHDTGPSPACFREKQDAYEACVLAASAAGGTLVSSPTGIGLVLGAITTATLAAQCSYDVRAALACDERATRTAELDRQCGSQGGVLLQGAGGDLVCLVTQ